MNNLQTATAEQIFSGGGEMGKRMRAYDWAGSSLGDVQHWPQSLKTCVRIILTSRQPMFVWWGKELINLYNDAYIAIAGGKHPAVLGMPASEVWREIWHQIGPRAETCMRKNEGTYDENLLLLMERNGYPEETYYTFSYSPVPGDHGEPEGIICANTDNTQRITSERQLRTLTGLGKQIADCATDTAVFDKVIAVLEQNQADFPFAFIYALQSEDTVQLMAASANMQPIPLPAQLALQQPEANDPWQLSRAFATGKIQVCDLPATVQPLPTGAWQIAATRILQVPLFTGGQKNPFAVLVTGINPHKQVDDQYAGFFQLLSDQIATGISAVHALEEERKRAAALAAIDSAKTAFFSNISHEFRTPLTLMLGPLEEMLQQQDVFLQNHHEQLLATHRNALRLQKLVNSLLDFSRIEAGRMQACFQPVQLDSYTIDLASSFRAAVEKAGLQYQVHCDAGNGLVYVDRSMWEKIVLNLLSNALKYTLQGTITVRQRLQHNMLVLQVEDTGVGIPESELPRMFERFHRIQNSTGRTHEGTGIGLSLVKELVELHKGHVAVSSVEGKGSVFTVTLPLGFAHLPAAQVMHNTDHAAYDGVQTVQYVQDAMSLVETGGADQLPVQPVTPGDARVLVVDDNADMRRYIVRLLQPYYQVATAANGHEALSAVAQQQPALVLSDVMMPVMDGIELLHAVKTNPATSRVPVILLSARAGEESRIEGFQTGADDYLVKPFSAKELLARVGAQLKLQQSRLQTEMHLRNLFAQAPVAISVVTGAFLTVDIANDRLLALWNKKAADVLGKPLAEAWPESVAQGIPQQLLQVYSTGERFVGHERATVLQRNNEQVTAYVNYVYEPIRDTDNHVTGIMVVLHDVTELVTARQLAENIADELERKVAERTADLKASNDALVRTNHELEQFAYVSSHDLQEPLRKIQTFSQLVISNLHKPGFELERYLQKINASASRMSALINDLLNFSRLSKVTEQFVPVDLNKVLQQVESDFELLIRQKGAVIKATGLPVLPAIPIQMNQLFYNMVSNALKFCETSPVITIAATTVSGDALQPYPQLNPAGVYTQLSFTDNGIGFEPRFAEQIFVIFQRLNGLQQYGGTGIGLAVCKKIADNHRGAITANSEPGKGSVFTVLLPL